MKKFLIFILGIQVALIVGGIWQLIEGNIGSGIFNISLNLIFGIINFQIIKRMQ